ncbi:TNPO1 protein, partial [Caloenas nicobarica]|nr:TNPO1 protein [Caloenas nicobarica]
QGAFGALQKICEDSAEILDSDVLDRPLNIMIPKFLQFFKHSSPKIREGAKMTEPDSLQWCPVIGAEARGKNRITGGSVLISGNTFSYCEDDQVLAKVAYRGGGVPVLRDIQKPSGCGSRWPYLRRGRHWTRRPPEVPSNLNHSVLIPVLVNGMKYSEIDIILLKGDVEEDEAIPDSEQDIRPRFHRSRTVAQQHEEDGIEDDDDDLDDDDDDDDTISDWNL